MTVDDGIYAAARHAVSADQFRGPAPGKIIEVQAVGDIRHYPSPPERCPEPRAMRAPWVPISEGALLREAWAEYVSPIEPLTPLEVAAIRLSANLSRARAVQL